MTATRAAALLAGTVFVSSWLFGTWGEHADLLHHGNAYYFPMVEFWIHMLVPGSDIQHMGQALGGGSANDSGAIVMTAAVFWGLCTLAVALPTFGLIGVLVRWRKRRLLEARRRHV